MASNQTKEFRKSVADMFVKGLSEKGLNWKRGWATAGAMRNATTNSPYKGLNKFYLNMISMVRGYTDPRWMTFKQIKDADYHLEKGSKGTKVEYWFPYDLKEKKGISFKERDRLISEGERKPDDFSLTARYYTVFNGDNINGIPELELPKNEIEPSVVLEQISKGMNVEIHNDGKDRAFYRPGTDDIHMPLPEVFDSDNEYNATAFHELGHATGHESRLNRDMSGFFGSPDYAKEELVAEITSAFMAETTGISIEAMNMDNHKAYVNSWIESIKDDPEVLMKAISQANDAADYMQQFVTEKEHEQMISNENEFEFKYRMLGRLQQDCEYYLGNGGRNANHALYYHDELKHIEEMKKLYDELPEKPEWLPLEKLNEYEEQLVGYKEATEIPIGYTEQGMEENHPDIYTFGILPVQYSPQADTYPDVSLSIKDAIWMADDETEIKDGLWKVNLPSENNPWLKSTYELSGFIEADSYKDKKAGAIKEIYSPCVYKMKWNETEGTYQIAEEVGVFTRIPTYNEFKGMYNLSDDDYIALAKEASGIEIKSSPAALNNLSYNQEPSNREYLNSIGDVYLKCIKEKGFVTVPERTFDTFKPSKAQDVHICTGDNEFTIHMNQDNHIYVIDVDKHLESSKGLEFIGATCYFEPSYCSIGDYELFDSDNPGNAAGANFFKTENNELAIELISDECNVKGFYPNNPYYKMGELEKGELQNLYGNCKREINLQNITASKAKGNKSIGEEL